MDGKSLEKLFQKGFGDLLVFLLERSWRSILAWVFIIVIAPPLIGYVHTILRSIPYTIIFSNIWSFLSGILNIKDVIYITALSLIIFWIIKIKSDQKKLTTINEDFQNGLRKWSIPINSHWLIEKTSDKSTKSLGIYSSNTPGLLKSAYNWYDYNLEFSARFKNEFSVIVRASSSTNGIMFKFTVDKITPYIICDGEYIEDDKQVEKLPVLFKADQWIDNISITVVGNIIHIKTRDISIQYKVPSISLKVSDDIQLWLSPNLSTLEESNKKIDVAFDKWIKLYEKESEETNPETKSRLSSESDLAYEEYKKINYKTMTFDYQTGSIGFKNDDEKMALINNVTLKQT